MKVWIVLAVIAGGGAIVTAQVGMRGIAVSGQGAQQFEGTYAKVVNAPALNSAQKALRDYMIDRQLRLIDMASNETVVRSVILNNCTGMMYVLNKAQQRHELNDILQIDKFQPSPSPWDQVRNAPSMVSELMKIGADQSKKIEAISKRYLDEEEGPWQAFFASKEYAAMTPMQRSVASKEFAKKQKGNLTPAQLADKSKGRSERQLAEMRAVLTGAQRAEWDAIKAKYDGDMARAINVARP